MNKVLVVCFCLLALLLIGCRTNANPVESFNVESTVEENQTSQSQTVDLSSDIKGEYNTEYVFRALSGIEYLIITDEKVFINTYWGNAGGLSVELKRTLISEIKYTNVIVGTEIVFITAAGDEYSVFMDNKNMDTIKRALNH